MRPQVEGVKVVFLERDAAYIPVSSALTQKHIECEADRRAATLQLDEELRRCRRLATEPPEYHRLLHLARQRRVCHQSRLGQLVVLLEQFERLRSFKRPPRQDVRVREIPLL